jgi:hypothetical protein
MGRLHTSCVLAWMLAAGAADAALGQEAPASPVPAADVTPGPGKEGVVHVNAMKNPEMHSYRAIVAGLDTFDEFHAMAPKVPRLLFAVRSRNSGPLRGDLPSAKLQGEDFALALPVDADARFEVPRSRQAWDTDAELILSRKRKEVRVWPYIRTPGLADNQRRLGDIRLECRVMVAIAKKEASFYVVALVNTVLLTGDWCTFMKDKNSNWSVRMPAELASAVLVDGNRSRNLRVEDNAFMVPLFDTSWSDDALIEVAYASAAAPAAGVSATDTVDATTRTAGETPRTGP